MPDSCLSKPPLVLVPSTTGAAEPSGNHNLVCTEKAIGDRDNGLCGHKHKIVLRISAKGSPQICTPPSNPPPKAVSISQNSHKDAAINGISSTSLRRSHEQMEQTGSQIEAQCSKHTKAKGKTPEVSVNENQARTTIVILDDDDDDDAPIKFETSSEDTDPNILHGMSRSSSEADKNFIHTLEAIKKKHGDITRDSSLESDCMKTLILVGVCKVVQDLQNKQLKDLDVTALDNHYKAVKDAENMKVNVQWLLIRLDEIRNAIALADQVKGAANEKIRRVEFIRRKEEEALLRKIDLERLKCEIQDIQDQLAQEDILLHRLNENIRVQSSKFQKFEGMNLMDGLL